jgi:cytochrome c
MGLFTIFIPEEVFPRRSLLAWASQCLLVAFFLGQSAGAANSLPGLGRVPHEAELATLPKHVFADGSGLPQGSGDSKQGERIYASVCAGCHGSEGQGGSAMELVGDRSLLGTEYPDRGIAVYWPYAPTLFEYIKRAMPPDKPYSLSDDELYSVIARLLELNNLIDSGQRVDAAVLSSLQMPNKDNFRSGYIETDRGR